MIDAATYITTTPFQWGPIITGLVLLGAAAAGWGLKRVLTRLDTLGLIVDKQGNRLTAIETKQNIAAAANYKVATRVGVPPEELEQIPS